MSIVAGIASKGCSEDVLLMLGKLSHRAKEMPKVTELGNCTYAQSPLEREDAAGPRTGAHLVDGKLLLTRDALGIQPLYHGRTAEGSLCFASEVKALLPLTSEVYELLPGTTYDGKDYSRYFSLELQPPSDESPQILAAELRRRLAKAVERCVSDDTGASWLSGGLDSSSVVALARPHFRKMHTFAAGLPGAPDLEAARAVADFVKTEHHEIVVSKQDLLRVLPDVIYHLESFDALLVRSSLMNFLAGKAAAGYAAKVYSGEGGDELFAGYSYLKSVHPEKLPGELIDITSRLHNTALQRVDRCAAASQLTACVCFLDPSVVEYALRVPVEYKLRAGVEKWILREAVKDLLPQSIVERPKAKFWEGAGVGEILAEHAQQISDSDFASERRLQNGWILASKEELMYYRIFRDRFGSLPNLDWMGRTKTVDQ